MKNTCSTNWKHHPEHYRGNDSNLLYSVLLF
ncbi:hypothetical protein Asd1617_02004 [Shigella dysenteriae 1617]|uniref:Uncharacterized protein n=1 Tax=Shigella dysenteriae 1617 TaxID=754093 RepID=A0A0A6ZTA1_SHIDY|nr:hypothetical protein Asd1617_02004 [Shigella dysenteriae 1617]